MIFRNKGIKMYLHAGNNMIINEKEIIGIFDLDGMTVHRECRDYLNKMEKENKIINISEKLPKSFIVCSEDKNQRIYLSSLMTSTLSRRKLV